MRLICYIAGDLLGDAFMFGHIGMAPGEPRFLDLVGFFLILRVWCVTEGKQGSEWSMSDHRPTLLL